MNIIRRNPSALPAYRPRSMDDQLGRVVDNLFEEMLSPFLRGGAPAAWPADSAGAPRLSVSETDAAFEVQAELPGVKKEDVKVAVEHQRVSIEAEARSGSGQGEDSKVLYSERGAGKFSRSFVLPAEVDEASAYARMEDGILTLTLPKKQGSEATRITIQ